MTRRPIRRLAIAVAITALVVGFVPLASAQGAEARVAVAHPSPLPARSTVVASAITTSFDLALTQPNEAALRTYLADLTNPSSPVYRHFLSTAAFARRFGAPLVEVGAVRRYFESFGLHVGALSRGHIILPVSGSTTAIGRAFATPLMTVRVDGRLAAQFGGTASLPAAIAHDVAAVAGLSTVVTPHALALTARASTPVTTPTTCAAATDGASATATTPNSLGGYTVQQQAQLYGLSTAWAKGFTGAGQTIAVYELGPYSPSDLATYFSCYGLSPSVTNVAVDGGNTGAYSDEATIDVEEAAALAPGAAIDVYTAPNNSTGPIDAYQQIADDNVASIVTTSWGTCEQDPSGAPNAEQAIFEQMTAQGQTILAAAGDNGSSDCTGITTNAPAVDDPASQPFVTGVGGLTISSISPLNETVWNDGTNSGGGAGGGGISSLWSRPSWQVAPGIAPTETMRLVPDLSVMADPGTGFIQYFTGGATINCGTNCGSGWSGIGGTSIGPPLMSAVVATAAQQCGVSRLGFINPALYAMATTGFIDVTTGSNDLFGVGVYNAGPGYDMASGLGSPNPATFMGGLCPIVFDPSTSSASVSTPHLDTSSTATVSFTLLNHNGGPMADALVALSATASTGRVLFDADHSSIISDGRAAYSVTTDANGHGSATVSNSEPGPLTVTVTYQGTTLLSSVLTVSGPGSPAALARPSIARVTALVGRARVTVRVPTLASGLSVTGYQYSINGGKTWRSAGVNGASIVIAGLAKGVTYRVIVRYLVGGRASPASAPATVTTRTA